MQQNYGFHEVPLNVLPEVSGENGGTSKANTSPHTTKSPQAQNTSQRPFSKSLSVASVSSINCPPNELLANLDGELCLVALEHILTLAASQSLLALKNPCLPTREKQLIRREISSELLSYHEFVRKKVLIDFREHNKIWHRRKHGQVLMQQVESEKEHASSSSNANVAAHRFNVAEVQRKPASSDLRVNVVRRLHLQQQHQKTPGPTGSFEMSRIISPIGAASSKTQQPPAAASTPTLSRPPLRRPGETADDDSTKRVHIADEATAMFEIQEEEEDILFPPEEPKFSALSFIQFVEEDYLHFMSNLFFVVCQND